MKKIYALLAVITFTLASCSRDFDEKIVGFWEITEINRIGLGNDANSLPFQTGTFNFSSGGGLIYHNPVNGTYTGTWDIIRKNDADGFQQALQITVVNFNTQQILSHYYDDLSFPSGNRMKARSNVGNKSYMTHFSK